MEDAQRRQLYNTVVHCRQLLEADFARQLEGTYGIRLDGSMEPTSALTHLDAVGRAQREAIEAAIDHARRSVDGSDRPSAVQRYVRESAFTFLNRMAALKLMEHSQRALIPPSVADGVDAKGFGQFKMVSPAALHGEADGGYRFYLELLFDDLGQALGVLFDRSAPTSILFPGQATLAQMLAELNEPELQDAWAEDETIGWIYQYFTPTELREEARKASSAPRNSYELAFRNQFYTPRYVVAFLADNTLGRVWYEMRKGETQLIEQCKYLIRRPLQVFLSDEFLSSKDPALLSALTGDFKQLPVNADWNFIQSLALMINGYDIAQKLGFDLGSFANARAKEQKDSGRWRGNSLELWLCLFFEQRRYRHFGYGPEDDDLEAIQALYQSLRQALMEGDEPGDERTVAQAVYIGHRPKRDPRALRALDPASGSGHYLLYSFDLLRTIYEEAYDDPELGSALKADFPDRDAYILAIPRLILTHSLYGIDIDRRATQIAALALWLRAQRVYAEMGIKPRQRPRLPQPHVVAAEPMPGEYDLLGEFARDLKPAVLGNMLRDLWGNMKLAGEAGSLLKIEKEIESVIRHTRKKLAEMPAAVQMTLFTPEHGVTMPERLNPADLNDEAFWAEAEERVVAALRRYARQTARANGAGRSTTRRLFADEAAQGIAFITLLQQKYDVVLMNPPFGAASTGSKDYIKKTYPRTKNDLYAAFVERGLELLHPGGYLGAITSRTGFFLTTFQQWREEILQGEGEFLAMADLGYGVLDTAMVETAAYVLQKKEMEREA